MPDGKTYHVLRSGNWYNGSQGHSRVSNRNPAHFRGPHDPCHPWYHIGFRTARSDTSGSGLIPETVTKPGAQATTIAEGFNFAEGPAANNMGEIFFSDLQAGKIYKLDNKERPNIFFHGHDRFFARQELDGVIYQLVPQPSHHNFKRANQAETYDYVSGETLPNSGHLRMAVSPSDVTVDYVRAYLPENENRS